MKAFENALVYVEGEGLKKTNLAFGDKISSIGGDIAGAEVISLPDDAVVVNVQGDEPLMPVDVVDAVAELLISRPECAMATAAHTIDDLESFLNPNVVKVELDACGNAMTFSRAPIPWPRDAFRADPDRMPEGFRPLHHLGLYAYRVSFLKKFPTLPPSPLEATESLEQLRAMYHGDKIAVLVLDAALPAGVDTEEDLERVRAIYRERIARGEAK